MKLRCQKNQEELLEVSSISLIDNSEKIYILNSHNKKNLLLSYSHIQLDNLFLKFNIL